MAFDLDSWREKVRERLKGWKERFEVAGVGSVYGFLCGTSLWPVVEAGRSGDWAAMAALGGALGGIGTSLLASSMQRWKDEKQAAAEIAEGARENAELREGLDAVLEKLEALSVARAELAKAEQEWFVATLRKELTALGNLERFQATLIGPGAIAQGPGAVAAGDGGIAAGRDINLRINLSEAPRDASEALAVYCQMLAESCGRLPLRGIDVGASDATGARDCLNLAKVYVALDLKKPMAPKKKGDERPVLRPDEVRPMRALEAVAESRHTVLLGDPGSGKSTFLNHLALCLAAHHVHPGSDWLAHVPDWPRKATDSLPVCVTLRDFAKWLPAGTSKADLRHLWDFIVEGLERQNLGLVVDPLEKALTDGRAVVFLDGLDEIPDARQRSLVRDSVALFVKRYRKARFIVTCRTLSYQDPAWQLGGFPAPELAPLDEDKIGQFVRAWYQELAQVGTVRAEDAEGLADRLGEAVRRPDLARLAPNPLLLTVMALVHTHRGRLPEARALLYEEALDILLWRWEQLKVAAEGEAPMLRQLLLAAGRADVDLKRVLGRLAFRAHQYGAVSEDERSVDLRGQDLETALSELHPEKSRTWAQDMVTAMKLRAGILLERAEGVFCFPHRTFQEYLAGSHLASQAHFARKGAELLEQGALWREPVLLAVGRLVYHSEDTDKPLALAGELCPEQIENSREGWMKVWFAGDALLEIGLNRVQDSALGRDLLRRVRDRLVRLLEAKVLSPVERAGAGNTLGRMGDPRFRADRWFLPDEPLLGFVEVPAGPFLMGSDKRKDKDAFEEELKQHPVELPTFHMARYPMTVAQFRAFVEESGFEPGDAGSLRGEPNHPVLRVSWHEAMAYCDWLTERLNALAEDRLRQCSGKETDVAAVWQDLKNGRLRAMLPSEAEWEKAARGTDGRIYPWGDEIDPGRVNCSRAEIGGTSAVGSFPAGPAPYGCLDMSGNVWEWTRSLWGPDFGKPQFKYPYVPTDGREDTKAGDTVLRVLRGGAAHDSPDHVRCAVRYRELPADPYIDVGFRVVLSPSSLGSDPSDL